MKKEIEKKLVAITKLYGKDDLSMGDLLATVPCGRLTIEDAHEVYMIMQMWANGDKFYTSLGTDEKTLVNCLNETEKIVLP